MSDSVGQALVEGKPIHFEDVIQGAFYDRKGLVFILFTRHRPNKVMPVTRTMAQHTNGLVLAVDRVKTKGVLFRKVAVTLSGEYGDRMEFSPIDIVDAYEDSVVKFLALARAGDVAFPGFGQYTPKDFWTSLSDGKLAEALRFARR